MIENNLDIEVDDTFTEFSDNRLSRALIQHIANARGEQAAIQAYPFRKIAILLLLIIGSGVACVGSLSFLIGRNFTEEVADFLGVEVSDEVANGTGEFLAWVNVVAEAIFYIWTISSLLPPLEPDPQDRLTTNTSIAFLPRITSYVPRMIRALPNLGEWIFALTSAIPITLLSLIDQENMKQNEGLKYTVVASIGLITVTSNKFFLTRTRRQFKETLTQVWKWLKKSPHTTLDNEDLFAQVQHTLLAILQRCHTNVERQPPADYLRSIIELKALFSNRTPNDTHDLLVKFFNDASVTPSQPSKGTLLLVPTMAVFAALAWIGLIATVPEGMEKKLNAPPAVQYLLMVLAGIPLIEIGLSLGGEFGLTLSKLCNKNTSLIRKQASWIPRLLGYAPLGLLGMFSFATNATVTIQVFKSTPAAVWCLLPSAILGMGLINALSGTNLWNDCLLAIGPRVNQDKKIFANYLQLLERLQKIVVTMPTKELVALLLTTDTYLHPTVVRLTPALQDKSKETAYHMLVDAITQAQVAATNVIEPVQPLHGQAIQLLRWMNPAAHHNSATLQERNDMQRRMPGERNSSDDDTIHLTFPQKLEP